MTSRVGVNDVTTFSWDYRNRLTEAKRTNAQGTQDVTYSYDVWDRRLGKAVNGTQQFWTVYDGANPYADYNGSSWTRYLYGDGVDQLFAKYDGSNVTWYLGDMLGSVRQADSANGTTLYTLNYDSFGNIKTDSTVGDRFKYTGREWEGEIGQYYYRARYYNPSVGRFESEDPLSFGAGDTNLYRYAGNAATSTTDPSGLDAAALLPGDYLHWIMRGGGVGPQYGPSCSPQGDVAPLSDSVSISLQRAILAGDVKTVRFILETALAAGAIEAISPSVRRAAEDFLRQRGERVPGEGCKPPSVIATPAVRFAPLGPYITRAVRAITRIVAYVLGPDESAKIARALQDRANSLRAMKNEAIAKGLNPELIDDLSRQIQAALEEIDKLFGIER